MVSVRRGTGVHGLLWYVLQGAEVVVQRAAGLWRWWECASLLRALLEKGFGEGAGSRRQQVL